MNGQRDPDAILAAWLAEGPTGLPDPTRRAIAVSIRTTRQSRLPNWLPRRDPNMNGMSRYAVSAVAVVAVVVGGLYLLAPGPDQRGGVGGPGSPVPTATATPTPSASSSPSVSPTLSPPLGPEPSVGALTQTFTSPTFGYALRYPAGWIAMPMNGEGPTPGGADEFVSAAGGWYLRMLSRAVPDGVVVDEWVVATLQHSDQAACMPPRGTQESVTIDGREGRILGFCGNPPAPQIEATVVVEDRAFLFSLYDGRDPGNEKEARALFDRLMETVTLDPRSPGGSPSPGPS